MVYCKICGKEIASPTSGTFDFDIQLHFIRDHPLAGMV